MDENEIKELKELGDYIANIITSKQCDLFSKAISEIESLRDQLRKAEERERILRLSSEWISVKDKLPKNGEIVFIRGGTAVMYGMDWWTDMERPRRKILWKVTHWLPLQSGPQSIEQADKVR